MKIHPMKTAKGTVIHNPRIARFLFDDIRFAPVWTVIRVLLGWAWLQPGLRKLGDPKWMETGEALRGFWERAVAIPEPPANPEITFDWYRSFIQGLLDSGAYTWFAKLIAVGETLVGIALIIGAFVGLAAFFGGFMNWNYLLAGSNSSNPLLFVAAMLLVLAWKTAGYYGLDRILLSNLGTPWTPGTPLGPEREQQPAATGL